jgi:predicted Zn-dependent protease
VEDPALAARLIEAAPQLGPVRKPGLRFLGRAAMLAAASSVLLLIVFFGIPMISGPLAKAAPYSLDVRLGETTKEVFLRVFHNCIADEDREALKIVRDLVARVTPEDWPHPVETHVVRSGMVNAVAIPGGTIVITTGFLRFIEHPDELAAVSAHEVGHLIGRHSLERAIDEFGVSVFFDAAGAGNSGPVGALSGAAGLATLLAYNRGQEHEADVFALQRLKDEGISPLGIALFFERITGKGPSQSSTDAESGVEDDGPKVLDYVSTHPNPGDRARLSRDAAEEMGPTEPSLSAEDFAKVQAMCPYPRWSL